MMPYGVFIEQQSFAEGIICIRGSLLEPFSNTINENEVNVEKEGKAKSCYYRFCSRLIPFGNITLHIEQMETAFKVYPSAFNGEEI